METHESFLKGYKPSYLCSSRFDGEILHQLHSLNYPHVIEYELEDFDNPGTLYDIGILFFQTEQLKSNYLAAVNDPSIENTYLLGKILGYPPVACKFFADANNNEELSKKRAGFQYQGYKFVGNIDDLDEIVMWLWGNVPAPVAGVEVEYEDEIKVIEPAIVT
jgi:hypothetical protein